jgi:rhodanese-related sulfurtransferase
MVLIEIWAVAAVGILVFVAWRVKRSRDRQTLIAHSIEAEELHALLEPERKVRVFDVRQPLDLLAYSEIIPGSVRIPPDELLENPSLIPRDEDAVVYCTCPGEKTSWSVVNRARTLNFTRLKLLRGGLASWKAKGYPVERYDQPFRLNTAK